jgi:thiamine monophosphate kinase
VNAQQARIEALLEDAAATATAREEVDLVAQTDLLSEGYDLRNLNRDLRRLRNA